MSGIYLITSIKDLSVRVCLKEFFVERQINQNFNGRKINLFLHLKYDPISKGENRLYLLS
jgi:hypothetical protein